MHEPVVYFVQDTHSGWVKIGTTTDVQGRLRTLRTANRSELRLLALLHGGHRQESAIHRELAAHRLRGEWFARDAVFDYLQGISADRFAFARPRTDPPMRADDPSRPKKRRWNAAQKRAAERP